MFTWLRTRLASVSLAKLPADFSAGELPAEGHGKSPYVRFPDQGRLIALAEAAAARGDLTQAVQAYEQAVGINPNDAALRVVLGASLIRKKMQGQATKHLNRALLLDPNNAYAFYFLGKCAQDQGDFSGAIEHFNQALEINPEWETVISELAACYLLIGRPLAAKQALLDGLARCPRSAQLHFRLGMFCADEHNYELALQCYDDALSIDPAVSEVHWYYAQALQQQGDIAQAVECLRKALHIKPDLFAAHSSLLWLLSFHADGSPDQYGREARRYGANLLACSTPLIASKRSRGERLVSDKLRVGFVSGDFREHPVGYFLQGVLKKLNPAKLELLAYSMNPHDDETTERIKGCFSQWNSIVALSDEDAARKIYADEVDILIDVAGHSAYNRLPVFAWKPARIQVSWLGYLATTGVPGMDYMLADAVAVPENIRHQFTEEIWYLPETFNCFTPPDANPKLAVAAPPMLRNRYITFGSFQRINKLSDSTLSLWARVLDALPTARLCLRNSGTSQPKLRATLMERLQRAGVAPGRVMLEGAIRDRAEFLATYAQIDIILDTPAYPGTTSTCEALWMGVPTLTLAGSTMLQRVGASLMICAGLHDWVARSEDEYVALAVRHVSDVDGLARLRRGLRQQVAATPLFDAGRFAPQLEEALIAIWKRGTRCLTG